MDGSIGSETDRRSTTHTSSVCVCVHVYVCAGQKPTVGVIVQVPVSLGLDGWPQGSCLFPLGSGDKARVAGLCSLHILTCTPFESVPSSLPLSRKPRPPSWPSYCGFPRIPFWVSGLVFLLGLACACLSVCPSTRPQFPFLLNGAPQ